MRGGPREWDSVNTGVEIAGHAGPSVEGQVYANNDRTTLAALAIASASTARRRILRKIC
jgi:hypothetical protein